MQRICFLGATGSGKSHTIRELLRADHPLRQSLTSSDAMVSETLRETEYAVSDSYTLIDTRGLDSEDIDDAEILASIELVTDSQTLFVLVVNGNERRLTAVRLAANVIRDRAVLVYVNERDNTPIDASWAVDNLSEERRTAILRAFGRTVPITTKHWAIVPHIAALATGVHPRVDVWLQQENDKLTLAHSILAQRITRVNRMAEQARFAVADQIDRFEHNRYLRHRYDNTFLAFLFATAPESSDGWKARRVEVGSDLDALCALDTDVGKQARSLKRTIQALQKSTQAVAGSTLYARIDATIPAIELLVAPQLVLRTGIVRPLA